MRSNPKTKSVAYLDRLLSEIEELRRGQTPCRHEIERSRQPGQPGSSGNAHPEPIDEARTAQNPILQESHWFERMETSDMPIWIGEISDAAFATRVRQLVMSPQTSSHIPRTHYVSDDTLWSSSPPVSSPVWPSSVRAKFLVNTALRSIRRSYHIVRCSDILSTLDRLSDGHARDHATLAVMAKMWALFALGELYSSRCIQRDDVFPGLSAFSYASQVLRVVSERPVLDVVEALLLLALYSLEVNRRHSTYALIGTAIRLQNVMGLHLNIDGKHISSPEIREHRNRLWWTTFAFDRMLSSKIGLPVSIADGDILVDLPSDACQINRDDFMDHNVLIASIHLARIAGRMVKSVYGRTIQQQPFLERVQGVYDEMQQWSNDLPQNLQFGAEQHNAEAAGHLHLRLSYNQLLITAGRPVLLYIFCHHLATIKGLHIQTQIPNTARTIAESCARYARQSLDVLSECWTNGIFDTFNYSFTQYLFSSVIVLAISSAMDSEDSQSDLEKFHFAADLLSQLDRNGNFAAKEFCCHVNSTSLVLKALKGRGDAETSNEDQQMSRSDSNALQALSDHWSPEATLQWFSADQDLNLSFLDNLMSEEELQRVFSVAE
ncbi:hypothetical protein G7054_g3477 [Neopestalotiopsis clavispora]|nr:hypothetical protein G7054_g3477 [Neopestalotiopsis clavispora]